MLPFARFAGADSVLGPEMKSTGEVMGVAARLPDRVRQGAGGGRRVAARREGTVFITVTDTDKPAATQLAARFHDLGFRIVATAGHRAGDLADGRAGRPRSTRSPRARPTSSTTSPRRGRHGDQHPDRQRRARDGYEIRSAAVRHGIPCITTMTGASAAARAIFAAARERRRGALAAGAARGASPSASAPAEARATT